MQSAGPGREAIGEVGTNDLAVIPNERGRTQLGFPLIVRSAEADVSSWVNGDDHPFHFDRLQKVLIGRDY
jgi:hypothetical protein